MRDFGIRMEGCEDAIEAIVKEACGRFDPFRYLEIGVGGGGTLKAVTDIARENRARGWTTIGIDLPEGWSLNMDGILMRMPDIEVTNTTDPFTGIQWSGPNLILCPSTQFLSWWATCKEPGDDGDKFHVVLIDGCHGKACVMADFLGVEPIVEKGGYVIFHDAGIEEQGLDMQPHCGEPIRVLDAIFELKLAPVAQLDDSPGPFRDGWRYHSFIPGDKSRGGHSCVVVQKV